MINEEGGIDPEQFRMEAMFDRMDAIGKGVLGLTIQCAQCHNHKFDPLTQEEYYRMFAFLNNAHEATVAVYTPAEQKKSAEIARKVERDRGPDPSARTPTGQSGWPRGRISSRRSARVGGRPPRCRRGFDRRPEVSAAGRRLVPGPGLRADQAHGEAHGQDRRSRPIRAFRLELLNDPNLPLGGPGRSIKGTVRPDRVRGRGRAGGRKGQGRRREDRPAPPPTSIRPRRRWMPISTTGATVNA